MPPSKSDIPKTSLYSGSSLTKQSAYWTRKRAMELMTSNNNAVQVSKSYMDILSKYKTERYTRYIIIRS
ncbi:hypothetical protein DPMN_121788 [Dreissena polymorpha]|uniref:Uncharacterized protein n=1 Tax=Dreissena polymorpha TaxID=45954 RepID=A0A9D4GMS3_DREPO|nr:hypothetical protein DPMN_121788 [Dreissena polymorpha]